MMEAVRARVEMGVVAEATLVAELMVVAVWAEGTQVKAEGKKVEAVEMEVAMVRVATGSMTGATGAR